MNRRKGSIGTFKNRLIVIMKTDCNCQTLPFVFDF